MTDQSPILDVSGAVAKERTASFTLRNRITRAVWNVAWLALASWTPKPLAPWRRLLLRLFGAEMGRGADVRGSARVWLPSHLVMQDRALIGPGAICYNMAPIRLEAGALVSQRAHLCAGTHDIDSAHFQLRARPITIGEEAWIAAEAFVGPGVTVGDGAVLGARAVAMRNLEPLGVYSGNPATLLRRRGRR